MCPLPKTSGAPLLCYVTDRRLLRAEPAEARKTLLDKIAAAAGAGLDWIHIREKDLSGRELSELTREAVKLARLLAGDDRTGGERSPSRSPRILVNDRLDVALAADAGGVHLGEHGLPPAEAARLRKRLGRDDFLIGVSCHSPEAAKRAEGGGADYIFFGPVFATPSKAAYGAPQGLDRLGEVCRAVTLPVLAIGGITPDNALACLSAGASGIAAIRLFQGRGDLAAVVQALAKRSR